MPIKNLYLQAQLVSFFLSVSYMYTFFHLYLIMQKYRECSAFLCVCWLFIDSFSEPQTLYLIVIYPGDSVQKDVGLFTISPLVIMGILLGVMLEVIGVRTEDVFVVSCKGKGVVFKDCMDIHLFSSCDTSSLEFCRRDKLVRRSFFKASLV